MDCIRNHDKHRLPITCVRRALNKVCLTCWLNFVLGYLSDCPSHINKHWQDLQHCQAFLHPAFVLHIPNWWMRLFRQVEFLDPFVQTFCLNCGFANTTITLSGLMLIECAMIKKDSRISSVYWIVVCVLCPQCILNVRLQQLFQYLFLTFHPEIYVFSFSPQKDDKILPMGRRLCSWYKVNKVVNNSTPVLRTWGSELHQRGK